MARNRTRNARTTSPPAEQPPAQRPFRDQPPILFSPEQMRKYNDIIPKKKVKPTLVPNQATLLSFGLLDSCRELFVASGLDILFARPAPTYPAVLKEFLASFSFQGDSGNATHWYFSLKGRDHTIAKAEICALLGFPLEGFCGQYSDEERYEFWKGISGFDYYFTSSWPSSCIKDKLWKVVHRLVSMSIFPRGEGATNIGNPELDVLISMHRRRPVDFFQILTGQMVLWGSTLENIALGGGLFVTIIAESVGWEFSQLPAPVTSELTAEKMVDIKMINRDREWQHRSQLPSGKKRHRVERRQRTIERARGGPPPEDDVMNEAQEPPVAAQAPPPQPPAVGQSPLTFEERLARLEASQHQITESQSQIMGYQRRILASLGPILATQSRLSVSHNQLKDVFSDFRYQASRAQQWSQDAWTAFYRHQGFTDYPPPPSFMSSAPDPFEADFTMAVNLSPPPTRQNTEAGPSCPAPAGNSDDTADLFGVEDDAEDDGAV